MNVREDESDEEYENLAKDESDRFDEVEATEDMEIEDEALFSLPSSNNVKWKKMKEVKSASKIKLHRLYQSAFPRDQNVLQSCC